MATKKRPYCRPARRTPLRDELERVKSSLLNREELDPISAAADAKRKSELAAQMGTVTSKAVTEKLSALSLDTQSTLDALRTTLISSTQELEELREMIAIESERLEELYGKDVVAASIATLVEEYDQKKRDFEDFEAQQQADLAKKIAEQKKFEAERKAAAEKERKQNEEEYEYQLAKSRRENTDAFNQKMLEAQRAGEEKARELCARGGRSAKTRSRPKRSASPSSRRSLPDCPPPWRQRRRSTPTDIVRAVTSEHNHKVALLEGASQGGARPAAQREQVARRRERAAAELPSRICRTSSKRRTTASRASPSRRWNATPAKRRSPHPSARPRFSGSPPRSRAPSANFPVGKLVPPVSSLAPSLFVS